MNSILSKHLVKDSDLVLSEESVQSESSQVDDDIEIKEIKENADSQIDENPKVEI